MRTNNVDFTHFLVLIMPLLDIIRILLLLINLQLDLYVIHKNCI